MESTWRSSGVWLGKYWKVVLAGAMVLTAALSFGFTRLQFSTGQDSYLNSDSQIAIDNVAYQDQFGGEVVILLFSADEGSDIVDLFEGDNLVELERVTAALDQIPEASSVITPLRSLEFSDALLKGPGRDALISASQRDPSEEGRQIRTADLTLGLSRLSGIPAEDQQLSNPDWVELLLFANEGFSTDGDRPEDADRTIRASLASTFPDQQTAVGGVVLAGNSSLDEQSAATDAVLQIMAGVELDGFEVTTTGSPVFLKEINDYLQGGMLTLGLAALAVMAVVLLLLFPVRWRLLPLLAVVFGVTWAFALLGFVGIDLSLVTISGLPILIGLGIDFSIQIHNRVEEEVVEERAVHPIAETLANLGPALLVATIAAIAAFVSLRVSLVPMIRDFGLLLAIGVAVLLFSGVLVTTAVLGIREWTTRTGERKPSRVERLVVALGGLPTRVGPVLAVAAIAVFVIGGFAERGVEIESDPVRWIDQDGQVVADVDRLNDETGFSSTLGILVEANNTLAPEVNELLWGFTQAAEARPQVVTSSSLVSTMAKIIAVPGASDMVPLPVEMAAAAEVMPESIASALLVDDRTATQVNLRLAAASLAERSELVDSLAADLDSRIEGMTLRDDSVLRVGLADDAPAVRAVPSGLAMVGIGLLDNLTGNRLILTYVALAAVALWLLLRYGSVARMALTMLPVLLAVGVSAIVVGAFGLTLSPLTTVGGPLVIATCTEFSVLILARYLEERQHGHEPRAATDLAAARTGRAFFTSAATTIGGFAVLIGSALPLLRDFGLIVTLNVTAALLAALVVLPPLVVWADEQGLLKHGGDGDSVRLGAWRLGSPIPAVAGVVVLVAGGFFLLTAADRSEGSAEVSAYTAAALPTTTTTTTTTPPAPEVAAGDPDVELDPDTSEPASTAIDVSAFGSERPAGLIDGILFDQLTAQGVDPQAAVCTAETLLSRTTQDDLLAAGIANYTDEAVVPVIAAGLDCGIDQATIDATLDAARGG